MHDYMKLMPGFVPFTCSSLDFH